MGTRVPSPGFLCSWFGEQPKDWMLKAIRTFLIDLCASRSSQGIQMNEKSGEGHEDTYDMCNVLRRQLPQPWLIISVRD
jgi:hypothetical protein